MSERERRIPTPLVLAIASAMVCIGLVAVFMAQEDEPEDPDRPSRVTVDDRTPEAAAESFLDAWRKREHDVAASLAVGEALTAVRAREERDAHLSDQERDLQRQVWDAMATSRLDLFLRESENLPGGDLRLAGVAEGEFLERPYEREMEFVMKEVQGAWRIESIHFGEILTELPAALHLED